MSAGKLKEPKLSTDFHQRVVCTLPVGFYSDDARWDISWQHFEAKADALRMADLKALFSDEATLQNPAIETGELFNHRIK